MQAIGAAMLNNSPWPRPENNLLMPTNVANSNYDIYSASALLAMQSAVLAREILSVRPSVRHVPVLCPDE